MTTNINKNTVYTPASDWAEATPLGNGRIGAMLYGDPNLEHIALNHDRLWRSFLTSAKMHTHRDFETIRALCHEGKYKEAELAFRKTLPYHARGCVYINPFVPLADAYVRMMFPKGAADGYAETDATRADGRVKDYSRTLDMENGVATVRFVRDGITYTRECFCPIGTRLCILRLSTDTPATLTGEVSLSRIPDAECTVNGAAHFGELCMLGEFDEGRRFASSVRVLHRGGRLTLGKRTYGLENEAAPERHFGLGYVFDRDLHVDFSRGASLYFDSCDEVILVISAATDVESRDPLADARTLSYQCPYEDIDALRDAHTTAFSSYYNRTRLSLSDSTRESNFPTLIEKAQDSGKMSPELLEHLWHFSRYVAIASGLTAVNTDTPKAPINLQGLWNRDTRPAWESDYHPDLNLAMCYQSLPAVGLADLCESVLLLFERTLPSARERAKLLFGKEGAHFLGCLDASGVLSPVDTILCGWLGCGAWYMQILWQYYEYAPSEDRLRRIYALMEECCTFYLSMLEEDADGHLTYPFGASPEMGAVIDGEVQYITSASTIDLALSRELFTHAATAADLLGDHESAHRYRETAARIRPLPIDAEGRLSEWVEPHIEEQPGHRHRSPFVTFHPGNSITRRNSPEIVAAMERLLDYRLAQGTSMAAAFSHVLDSQLLARLGRGDEALAILYPLTQYHMLENGFLTINDYAQKGGLSWFPGIKVMQVEALLGVLGVVTEMLLSDADGILTPLPALPTDLPSGSCQGLRVRAPLTVDISWQSHRLTELVLHATDDTLCQIDLSRSICRDDPMGLAYLDALPVGASIKGGILSLHLCRGEKYVIRF